MSLAATLAGCGGDGGTTAAVDWGMKPLTGGRTHSLAAGAGHTCAVAASGDVYCWGSNPDGQLGDGLELDRPCPGRVMGIERAVAVSAGSYHACALDATGAVSCWGWNVAGQIGDGTTDNALTAKKVAGLTAVIAIAAGSYHTCALLADGSASCWGQNDLGQLGDGSMLNRGEPMAVFSLPPATALAASGRHTCALMAGTGQVQCWGGNDFGELGDGTTTPHAFPAPVTGVEGATAVAAGFNHTCALLAAGTVACWGANTYGQLGNDSTIDSGVPVQARVPAAPSSAIATGYRHSCAMSSDGGVACWGWNDAGQLGDGTRVGHGVGVAVPHLPAAADLAGGAFHTCARARDGTLRCWGANESGQLGISSDSESESTPRLVSGPGC